MSCRPKAAQSRVTSWFGCRPATAGLTVLSKVRADES